MNKKIIYIALFGLLMLGFSCETYEDLIPEKYNKILALKTVGEQNITLYETGEDGTYGFTILKGGNNTNASAQAEIKVMNEMELEIYSQEVEKNTICFLQACTKLKILLLILVLMKPL